MRAGAGCGLGLYRLYRQGELTKEGYKKAADNAQANSDAYSSVCKGSMPQ
jgi:hypothetical protein